MPHDDDDLDAVELDADFLLSERMLRAIGLVAAEAAYLEREINDAIRAAADLRAPYGIAMLSHVNVRTRLDMLRALVHERLSGVGDTDLEALAKQIKRALAERNKYLHDGLFPDVESFPEMHALRRQEEARKGKPVAEWIPTTADEVERAAKRLARVRNRLSAFLEGHDLHAPRDRGAQE